MIEIKNKMRSLKLNGKKMIEFIRLIVDIYN